MLRSLQGALQGGSIMESRIRARVLKTASKASGCRHPEPPYFPESWTGHKNRKLDLAVIDVVRGSDYPPPFDAPCRDRERKRLGDAAGLSQFGVNLLRLPPGTWSSQRHWQTASDEFVYVVSGEVVLITGAGEETLRAGDAAGFKAGTPDGHHLQNRSTLEALVLEVGTRLPGDGCYYSDIDMMIIDDSPDGYTRRDGSPYARRSSNGEAE